MPLAIWVTRATSGAEARQDRSNGAPALDREALAWALSSLGAVFHPPDGAWWVRYRKTGEAWCVIHFAPDDEELHRVELSTSYSNPRFLRNMADMFDLALTLAQRLDARVFEETRGAEITASNIDAFLERDGSFVDGQRTFFRSTQEELQTTSRAPLEFPLGVVDDLPDYLQFVIRTEEPAPSLRDLCADTPAHLSAHVLEVSAILDVRERKIPAVRIIRLEDGVIVRPYWSSLPFAELAQETFRAVDRIERRFGKETLYYQQPCGPERRADLESHTHGLGVEYYEWLVPPRQR